jgi:lipopolysaccharide biosynthesis protein
MGQPDSGKRLCIFAHFDQDNIVDEYVLFYLHELKKVADRVIFVSAAALSAEAISRLRQVCDSVILRENRGYDFAGWQAVIKSETFAHIDELILCNDSVYGPFFPLGKVFAEMRERKCDFWGITSSHQIAFHLQSYFLVFRKPVLASNVFQNFWQTMEIPQSKDQVIELCEIGLSQTLLTAGFKAFAYTRYRFLVSRTLLYRVRSFLIRKVIGCTRSILFGISRRKKEKNIRTAVTRIFRYVTSIVSHTGSRMFNGLHELIEILRHPKIRRGKGKNFRTAVARVILHTIRIFPRTGKRIINGFYELLGGIRFPKIQLSAFFSYFTNTLRSINVTHLFWKQLILYSKMPFIKVDLLRDNPTAMNIKGYEEVISLVSDYEIPMIRSHLVRVKNGSKNKSKRF